MSFDTFRKKVKFTTLYLFVILFTSDVPTKLKDEFVTKDPVAIQRIDALKNYVSTRGREVRLVDR